jgi:putative phosphoesterase
VKVCIVSDSHDRADALAQAVREAKAAGAEAVIHCGDLIGAQTVKPALAAGLPIHLIHGNNVGDTQALHRQSRASGGLLQYHGADARLELGGRRVFVVHTDDYGYAMACTGHWDLVCCGHSHQAEARQVRTVQGTQAWLVNPGTVAGLAGPATWALADLAAMRFELHALGASHTATLSVHSELVGGRAGAPL